MHISIFGIPKVVRLLFALARGIQMNSGKIVFISLFLFLGIGAQEASPSHEALEKLKKIVQKPGNSLLHSSSIFSLNSHHHAHDIITLARSVQHAQNPIHQSDIYQENPALTRIQAAPKQNQLSSIMQDAQDVEEGATTGVLPSLPQNNAQQAEVSQLLQLAQEAEQTMQGSTGTKTIICRAILGTLVAGYGIADLLVNYKYINTNHSEGGGQQATNGVFSASTDLGIIGVGLHQFYLAITNWDNKQKQDDAAAANAILQQHLAAPTNSGGAAAPK